MKARLLLFLLVLVLVLATTCAYMGRRSMALSPTLARHPAAIWTVVALFLVLQFAVPAFHRLLGSRLVALSWISYLALSLVSTYFLYLAGTDLLGFILRKVFSLPTIPWVLLLAAGLTLLSTGIGLIQCLRPVRVHALDVPIQGLPPRLEGLRIAQLSDLHLGPLTTPARIRDIVTRTQALCPDLIAVTGDLADGSVDQERACLDALGRLEAPLGVFFVTGNHEYYSGAEPWLAALRALGWQVLVNAHAVATRGNAQLAIIGLPDPAGPERPDLRLAMDGTPREAFRLLLHHPPIGTEAAARAGIHLQLSGHVHGGQYFPWSPVVRCFFKHPTGLHSIGSMWLYISPGTGFWGPPNRFLVPPEITLLTLRPGPPASGR